MADTRFKDELTTAFRKEGREQTIEMLKALKKEVKDSACDSQWKKTLIHEIEALIKIEDKIEALIPFAVLIHTLESIKQVISTLKDVDVPEFNAFKMKNKEPYQLAIANYDIYSAYIEKFRISAAQLSALRLQLDTSFQESKSENKSMLKLSQAYQEIDAKLKQADRKFGTTSIERKLTLKIMSVYEREMKLLSKVATDNFVETTKQYKEGLPQQIETCQRLTKSALEEFTKIEAIRAATLKQFEQSQKPLATHSLLTNKKARQPSTPSSKKPVI